MDNFANSVKQWWAQPFNAQGSVVNWFLFLGLLIVLSIAWRTVILFITE